MARPVPPPLRTNQLWLAGPSEKYGSGKSAEENMQPSPYDTGSSLSMTSFTASLPSPETISSHASPTNYNYLLDSAHTASYQNLYTPDAPGSAATYGADIEPPNNENPAFASEGESYHPQGETFMHTDSPSGATFIVASASFGEGGVVRVDSPSKVSPIYDEMCIMDPSTESNCATFAFYNGHL